MYEILDLQAKNGASSRFINKKEYCSIYPDKAPRRLDFVFRNNRTFDVEKKIAFFLIRKYPSIKIINSKGKILNIKDDLDEIIGNELRKLASQYPFNAFGMGIEEIKLNIRECKAKGIEPIDKKRGEQRNEGLLIINSLPYYELVKKARKLGYKGKFVKTTVLEKFIEERVTGLN